MIEKYSLDSFRHGCLQVITSLRHYMCFLTVLMLSHSASVERRLTAAPALPEIPKRDRVAIR